MSMFTGISRFVARQRLRQAQARTERTIAGLPASVQKDLGWPDGAGTSPAARYLRSSVTETPQS